MPLWQFPAGLILQSATDQELSALLPSLLACDPGSVTGLDSQIGYAYFEEICTMSEIKYEIVKKIGVLSKSASGWAKELNLVSWNDREPKYDIREWSPDGEKMGKGVTLSKEELLALKELLNTLDL
jgi:hypothetical protein